jgi:hypothetical protein
MSTSKQILPPSNSILRVCDALDDTIKRFLQGTAPVVTGRYEADVEARLIFILGIRHVEGVVALARCDLVLLPAAYHLARAAFECCVRAAWLVNDENPMKREPRFLAHLDGEISAIRRSSERLERAGTNVDAAHARGRQLKQFRDDVARALQDRGVPLLKQIPKFEEMLSSIGGDHLYPIYIEASQYTHGGHAATWLYRGGGGVGTHKVIKETIMAEHWILPLRMCWLALCHPGDIVATRIARSADAAWSHECAILVEAAFHQWRRSLRPAAKS